MGFVNYESLESHELELIQAAEQALKFGYNPYRHGTIIAAAARTSENKIITGACFGNASATSNICAERSVILTANNQGQRKIKAIAVIGSSKEKILHEPITPCGICRQVLLELTRITNEDVQLICSNQDKTKILKTSVLELIPHPY